MTTVAIYPENFESPSFRAVAGDRVAVGKTAGEAMDALTSQIGGESSPLLIVQGRPADRFFGAAQQKRLRELMDRWRLLRDQNQGLAPSEQAELGALVEAELKAAADRADAVTSALLP